MKKKKKALIVLVVVLVLLVAWWYLFLGNKIKDASAEITKGDADTKALIVYFTRSGVITAEGSADAVTSASMNIHDGVTEAAAMQLQRLTGADLYEIRTERYYRNSFAGTAATAWIEETLNMRPGLAAKPDDLSAYDVIYVGFPIWWFNAPMAIGTFLEGYDLIGKTIVPFCTSQDNGIEICMDYIRSVSGGAKVLDGYRVNHSSDEDIRNWLDRIGVAG